MAAQAEPEAQEEEAFLEEKQQQCGRLKPNISHISYTRPSTNISHGK